MANGDTSLWNIIWTAVAGILSLLAAVLLGMFRWNWLHLQDEVRNKANLDAVESRHAENLEQFRQIMARLDGFETDSRKHRHTVSDSLNQIALDVAVLTERVGGRRGGH